MTVLETRVHQTSARNARLAFILTAAVTGVIALAVASEYMHALLAAFVAAAVGAVTGGVVWCVVRAWKLLRVIWWWLPEIVFAVVAGLSWQALADATNLVVRLLVLTVVVGVPAGWPPLRRKVVAWVWCLIIRHRLRMCFTQFITTNRSGSLPLIMWARPTPVGERVRVLLRPGLSLTTLQAQAERLAVACYATSVLIERVGGNAAYLRLDIKRREVLDRTIVSPLADMVDPDVPVAARKPGILPTALNLADVPDDELIPVAVYRPSSKDKAAQVNGTKTTTQAVVDDTDEWI
ncbi:hypothetical protein [Allocatelliglobosispora scoriae]|uniref:hypothetical protein n=1 Tax=Allocatelliglobosispora scoriae TaxID=643052 RepID=UPI0035E415F1